MSYTADLKDPAEAVIFSLDIVDDLASHGSETITGVTAAVSVHQGWTPVLQRWRSARPATMA